MTITISTDKVKVKLGETTLTDPQITENGTDAVTFLTAVFNTVTISDDLVSLVGVWYTAHMCRITEREIKTQKFGESGPTTFLTGEGLFLEEAMTIDTTGTLRNYIKASKNGNVSAIGVGY